MLSGQVEGVESLLRWQHPSLGVIAPDMFIPLLEETGLICDVGRWIIESVCQQLKQWRDSGQVGADFSAAINISSKQFHESDLASFIEQAIIRNGISPSQVKLELTESLLVIDTEQVADKLDHLKALGITICIDDFGTGYAALGYLRQFPIDVLKIDKSFVQNIGASEQDDAIVLAIINLAHDLRFKVVAEGVETQQQRAFLTQHQCDTFQGYLFSKPIPAEQVRVHNDSPGRSAYIHVA
jgi:EAL domain-containing protein (putative c-di-GMP-specific phosphodiesterase class I)